LLNLQFIQRYIISRAAVCVVAERQGDQQETEERSEGGRQGRRSRGPRNPDGETDGNPELPTPDDDDVEDPLNENAVASALGRRRPEDHTEDPREDRTGRPHDEGLEGEGPEFGRREGRPRRDGPQREQPEDQTASPDEDSRRDGRGRGRRVRRSDDHTGDPREDHTGGPLDRPERPPRDRPQRGPEDQTASPGTSEDTDGPETGDDDDVAGRGGRRGGRQRGGAARRRGGRQ